MRSDAPGKEDVRLRRRAAAFRLKHDLGKYIRFNAPEMKETVEDLRARLQLDLLSTRRKGSTAQSAVDVFFEWKKEEGGVFEEAPRDAAALATISEIQALVETVGRLLPSLLTFEEKQLHDLDRLSLDVNRLCLHLWKESISVSSSISSEVA